MNTPFDFMPRSCERANRIMWWLFTLAPTLTFFFLRPLAERLECHHWVLQSGPRPDIRGRGPSGWGGQLWRGIVMQERRANSCEFFSKMVGQGARKWSVAGCQGWKHSQPCLKPRHAPSTGAEKGWVKGIKKNPRTIKKRRHTEKHRGADWMEGL